MSSFAWSQPDVVGRRHLMTALGTGSMIGTTLTTAFGALAAAPLSPAEAVRRGAANIPGYGQTDVFYPLSFSGSWKAVRELQPSGLKLQYTVRYLPSIEDGAVVADRGWNQANLENAIAQVSSQKPGTSNEDLEGSLLPSYKWSETNPNDLRIKFADGRVKDIKVTKRATEKTDDTVSSSEFQRVTQDDDRGIPIITARRVVAKWRVLEGNRIEGIEIVYDVGGGDPLAGPSGLSEQNKILSKSRILLEKQ